MEININDIFWKRYTDLIRTEMIPYQWDVLHDNLDIFIDKERDDPGIPSEKSHAIDNLKIAAGQKEGNHYGWLFQDSDVYKWLESAANSYALKHDEKLLEMMDEVVSLIEDAQDEDGYLSTYYQIEAPELRFRRLFESHELYCAGHLIEASVAYYKATGSDRLIKVSEKFVDCIKKNFGPEEGKIKGADGHQEIEIALIKLYEVTNKEEYVDLSKWFLEIRGQDPLFYKKQIEENKERGLGGGDFWLNNLEYLQGHQPIHEQEEAVGHAVRLVYMAAAMAEVAAIHNDEKMFKSAKRLWDNIIKKRFYITGGIGSTVHGEAFTFDYDLPNDTMYCETCASIGLLFFARAMLENEVDVEYAEVMERTLYNTIISGMALDGKHFFYVNPLEVDPLASQSDPGKSHVKATRPSWFGCACCPPNLARTITSLNKYVTSINDKDIYVHLPIEFDAEIDNGDQVIKIAQSVSLLEKGTISLSVKGVTDSINIYVRLPKWGDAFTIKNTTSVKDNYAEFVVNEDKEITIEFDMPVHVIEAHPLVRANQGKVALQRGPFVYCLEEEDNGKHLHLLSLVEKTEAVQVENEKIGNYTAIKGKGKKRVIHDKWDNLLYDREDVQEYEDVELTFIPYYAWGNRSVGEMTVWVNKEFTKS